MNKYYSNKSNSVKFSLNKNILLLLINTQNSEREDETKRKKNTLFYVMVSAKPYNFFTSGDLKFC